MLSESSEKGVHSRYSKQCLPSECSVLFRYKPSTKSGPPYEERPITPCRGRCSLLKVDQHPDQHLPLVKIPRSISSSSQYPKKKGNAIEEGGKGQEKKGMYPRCYSKSGRSKTGKRTHGFKRPEAVELEFGGRRFEGEKILWTQRAKQGCDFTEEMEGVDEIEYGIKFELGKVQISEAQKMVDYDFTFYNKETGMRAECLSQLPQYIGQPITPTKPYSSPDRILPPISGNPGRLPASSGLRRKIIGESSKKASGLHTLSEKKAAKLKLGKDRYHCTGNGVNYEYILGRLLVSQTPNKKISRNLPHKTLGTELKRRSSFIAS